MNERDKTPESSSKGGKNLKGKRLTNKRERQDDSEEDDGSTNRCCARCRNHENTLVKLKGHKNYCPWRDCYCDLCINTVLRQKLMADQTASRRKRKDMEMRRKKGLPIFVPTVNELKRFHNPNAPVQPPKQLPVAFTSSSRSVTSSPCYQEGLESNQPFTSNPSRSSRGSVTSSPCFQEGLESNQPFTSNPTRPNRGKKEVSWEAITELMNYFNFNVNTSALLYLILKFTSNNVTAACSIIHNAKENIKKISNKALNIGTPEPYGMNQVETVPVLVVPSEKVLDLSYQPGLGFPTTPTQPYPTYSTASGPPQHPSFQQYSPQPSWHPSQTYQLNTFQEVPKDGKERRVEQRTRNDDKASTDEEEKIEIDVESVDESSGQSIGWSNCTEFQSFDDRTVSVDRHDINSVKGQTDVTHDEDMMMERRIKPKAKEE